MVIAEVSDAKYSLAADFSFVFEVLQCITNTRGDPSGNMHRHTLALWCLVSCGSL